MNSKITILFFIFCFSINSAFSQSGHVFYKKQLASINSETTNDYMKQALRLLNTQDYVLSFNEHSASFKKNGVLRLDNNPVVEAFAESLSGFTGEVYYNLLEKSIIHHKTFPEALF